MDLNSVQNGNSEPQKEGGRRFKPKAPKRRLIPKNLVVKSEVPDNDIKVGISIIDSFKKDLSAQKSVKFERKVEPSNSQPYNASRSNNQRYQDSEYPYTPNAKLKDYVEPWDYASHYPITHPTRRPYTGDPVLLDKEEFGSERRETCQQPRNAAFELGLMVEQKDPTFLRMQFPLTMPVIKPVAETETKEVNEGSKPQASQRRFKQCTLNELPACHMGKMRVYKSGAVKLHIGDVVYNVSPGVDCAFAQELVSINVADGELCALELVRKQAIITPDFDPIINKSLDANDR